MNRLPPETPIPSPSISQDGKLTIPLYHGTGDLFIESIKSTGLGARNIVEELGLRRAAQLLLELSEGFANEESWLMDRHFCKRLVEDPTKQRRDANLGFSYRYGGTYLTPSRQTAIRYALANPLGSEALSHVLSLFKRMIEVEPATARKLELQPLSVIARRTGVPILIQANGVEIDSLYAEQGGSPEKALLFIQEMLCDLDTFDLMTQQSNFETTRPIPPHLLETYIIECTVDDYPHFHNAKLVPC